MWPKPRSERRAAFLHLSVCCQNPRSETSAALLHLRVCGQNRGLKGARPSFTPRFNCGQNGGVQGASFTSRSEKSAAFLHLSVCGKNRGVNGARPSGLGCEGGAEEMGRKWRGVRGPVLRSCLEVRGLGHEGSTSGGNGCSQVEGEGSRRAGARGEREVGRGVRGSSSGSSSSKPARANPKPLNQSP